MKNQTLTLAIDRSSVRTKDVDGRLHIELTPISKAMVCPYYGHEIPDGEKLGLAKDKIYQLFRDPVELQRAASTFNNIQLLQMHSPVNADKPSKELTVGSTGTDAIFNAPYLKNSMVVWDSEAIAGIESGQIEQLSAGYYYTADMTPGEYEGKAYDGVMRNIIGNHIALVERGRAGPDVVVADQNPFFNHTLIECDMKKAEKRKIIAQDGALKKLAQDYNITQEQLDEIIDTVLAADEEMPEISEDEAKEPDEMVAEDEANETEEADKPALDAAMVDKIVQKKVDAAIDANNRMHQALKEVEPIVGVVIGMDSAEAVYKFALDHVKIDTDGVHPSAYKALVAMHKQTATSNMAQDNAINYDIATAFIGLNSQRSF